MNNDEIAKIAMDVILNAGDAKDKIYEALQNAEAFEFEQAELDMEKAFELVTLAHRAQTDVIQEETSGKKNEYSLLFSHAQDTLMVINGEYRMAQEMIKILKIICKKGQI